MNRTSSARLDPLDRDRHLRFALEEAMHYISPYCSHTMYDDVWNARNAQVQDLQPPDQDTLLTFEILEL
jgi:hypothetical protein